MGGAALAAAGLVSGPQLEVAQLFRVQRRTSSRSDLCAHYGTVRC
jgi:hypothetical protein